MNELNLKISNGNSKLGNIPNFSLTPIKTCSEEACKTCAVEGCYACKLYKLRKSVKDAWDWNTRLVLNDMDIVENELNKYFNAMNAPRFFRIHVGGDFVNHEYAEMWARVAKKAERTNFLAFTKQWEAIRGIEFADNVSIVLSDWPNTKIPKDLLELYSVAWIDDGRDCIPKEAIECPGNCSACGVCWSLAKMGIDTKFRKH